MIDRHHLLECILWPNGDGTFRKIVNRAKRLKELGIYDDFKLTIPIEHRAHTTMHREFESGTKYEQVGENTSCYGRTGDKHPMYGRTGEKSPNWKGDSATVKTKYLRAKRDFKNNLISKETYQTYKDAWYESLREYRRERRKNQRSLNSLPID
jgi:hypothetical protein